MKIIYTGTADTKSYSASDFKQAGLEHPKTTFLQGVETEVSDKVGEALLSSTGLFATDPFEKVEASDAQEALPLEGEATEDEAKAKKGKRANSISRADSYLGKA